MPEGRANQPQNGKAPARQRYTRAWEDLRDVLARLLHAGWTKQDAKEDVCRALAEAPPDRKIDFRVMVQVEEDGDDGAPPGYRNIKTKARSEGHWLNSQQVRIPPSLKPADFDWERSCPTAPWLTTFASSFADPRIGEEPERRKIDLIELRVSDVTNIFAPASILPSVAQPREIAPKQNPSNQGLRKITAGYIDEEKKAGRIPTKKGLEARAKSMNIRGNRQHLRDMFTELWPGAPGVGRPKKFAN
jgi:hypothetical protein